MSDITTRGGDVRRAPLGAMFKLLYGSGALMGRESHHRFNDD